MKSADGIYEVLLENIITWKLRPGEMISENQIAQEFGVSRTIVRQVFDRLRQMGFMEIYPQKGSIISLIDIEYIRNLLVLRSAVEKEAIISIMTSASQQEKERLLISLEENIRRQEICLASKKEADFQGLDNQFHQILLESAGKESVMNLIADRLLHVARYRSFNLQYATPFIGILVEEHRLIVEALRKNDLQEALDKVHTHLELKIQTAFEAIYTHREFFIMEDM